MKYACQLLRRHEKKSAITRAQYTPHPLPLLAPAPLILMDGALIKVWRQEKGGDRPEKSDILQSPLTALTVIGLISIKQQQK